MIKPLFVSCLLALGFWAGPLFAGGPPPISQQVTEFIEYYSQQDESLALTLERIREIALTEGLSQILIEQSEVLNQRAQELHSPLASDRWKQLQESQQMQQRAQVIVQGLFDSHSVETINLILLELFHRYLFEPQLRTGIEVLLGAIENHSFSEAQLHRLHKESQALYHWTRGTWVTALVMAPAILTYSLIKRRPHPHIPKIGGAKRTPQPKAHLSSTNSGAQKIDLQNLPEVVETESLLRQLGYLPRAQGGAPTVQETRQIVEAAPRQRFYQRLLTSPSQMAQALRHFSVIGGVAATGGLANVGLKAYIQATTDETSPGQLISPRSVQEDYLNGLASLSLSCRSHALVESLLHDPLDSQQLLAAAQEMALIFTEYETLKTIDPYLLAPMTLPDFVRWSPDQLGVEFSLTLRGELHQGLLSCPTKLAAQDSSPPATGPIEVHLQEVLYHLVLAHHLLSWEED